MKERPLSPHLQVYRPQLTSVMSILHRMTGAALAVGTLMIVWMLGAAALGEDSWEFFIWFCSTPVGTLMLFGWSVALIYHMCNGIRHMIWDMVCLLKIERAYAAGYVVLAATVVLTALLWWTA